MKEQTGSETFIRFITSDYRDLFRIRDGGTIQVTFPDRTVIEKCRFIDEYHTKIGTNIFHICEYAELLEKKGGVCVPEPEILSDQAAWQIWGRGCLLLERKENGFDYQILTGDYGIRRHGRLEQPTWSMNQAREHILDSIAMGYAGLTVESFDQIKKRMEEALKASEVTDIIWVGSKYYPSMRTSEHTLSCRIRGEKTCLSYEVSRHDDGEGFVIHSDGQDIWDRMPEMELRKLEPILSSAVVFGHWMRKIIQADTLVEIRDVRYGLFETENLDLTREQIVELHREIDRKEDSLLAAKKQRERKERDDLPSPADHPQTRKKRRGR